MVDRPVTTLFLCKFLLAFVLVVANLFLLSLLPPVSGTHSAEAKKAESTGTVSLSDDPNVIASGATLLANESARTVESAAYTANGALRSFATATTRASKATIHATQIGAIAAARAIGAGATIVARGVGSGVGFIGRGVGTGVSFVAHIPGNALGSVSSAPVVRGFIRPVDHADTPIINPNSPELQAAIAALPATKAPSQKSSPADTGPAWPIHGEITTYFGVDHWPYQQTHTGLDISDGQAPGVTPIKPFRPGRVIETVYSGYGLGNHVIVDHGNGVTSVYAHLASIAVQKGRQVGMKTILGYEGSTGASTGTHLHFEIRVNGQAADPRHFITGTP